MPTWQTKTGTPKIPGKKQKKPGNTKKNGISMLNVGNS